MASIAKVDNGWRARWRTPDGASRSRTFTKKSDAERFLDGVRGELVQGIYIDTAAAKTTLTTYAETWMAGQAWRESTRDTARSILNSRILPTFGTRRLSSLRRSELQAWVTGLGQTLAPATVEGTHRLLASILRSSVHDRIIPVSPADGVRLPRREGVMIAPPTVAEVEALAEAITSDLHGAVLFAALTGVRQGELFGLTEDRVRWLRREIVVDRQLITPPRSAPVLGPCKTARSVRTVPLADRAVQILSEQIGAYGPGEGGVIFHRAGKPWRRNRAADAIKATEMGVGWHALRHHCASVLIAQGLSVTAVAAVLGHSPAECLATYAAWWPSEDEAIRTALSRAWAGAPVSPACHDGSEG